MRKPVDTEGEPPQGEQMRREFGVRYRWKPTTNWVLKVRCSKELEPEGQMGMRLSVGELLLRLDHVPASLNSPETPLILPIFQSSLLTWLI